MNALSSQFGEPISDAGHERRRSIRHTVWALATMTCPRGRTADAELTDLSLHGVRIASEAEWLRIGQFVSITLEEEPPVQAIVRWMRDGEAGMEFLRPIPSDRKAWRSLMD